MTETNEIKNMEDLRVNQFVGPTPPSVDEREPLAAKITSFALHPIFMGIYGLGLLFLFTDFGLMFARQFWNFFTPVAMLSCVIPACGIVILKKMHIISDYSLQNKNERFVPFLITFLSYASLIYYFWLSGIYIFFLWYIALLVAPALLLIITAIINVRWKISAHMTGIGGLLGGVLSVCYNVYHTNLYILFIILFILAGCLGVSRLILKRHTPAQVYAGFVLGLSVSYICVWAGVKYALPFLKFIINS